MWVVISIVLLTVAIRNRCLLQKIWTDNDLVPNELASAIEAYKCGAQCAQLRHAVSLVPNPFRFYIYTSVTTLYCASQYPIIAEQNPVTLFENECENCCRSWTTICKIGVWNNVDASNCTKLYKQMLQNCIIPDCRSPSDLSLGAILSILASRRPKNVRSKLIGSMLIYLDPKFQGRLWCKNYELYRMTFLVEMYKLVLAFVYVNRKYISCTRKHKILVRYYPGALLSTDRVKQLAI
jgi:hypothetical protein